MKNVYFMKMLYFNAACAVYKHCYGLFSGLVNLAAVENMCRSLVKNKKDSRIFLSDRAGRRRHKLILKTLSETGCSRPCFLYMDREIDGCVQGLYNSEKNLFIYNDKLYVHSDQKTDLSNMYLRDGYGRYTYRQYGFMAKDFWYKSENIDISCEV